MYSSMLEVKTQHHSLRSAEEMITGQRPDLNNQSPTYRAAIVLLVAQVVGRGVHKLAKVSGYPSEFVARCARRLVDNGVWPDGQPYMSGTTVHDWDAFWQDVGVAEGKLCRRCNEFGQLEWAPPGQWWKDFDFAVGNRTTTETVIRYQPATFVPTSLLRDGMDDEDEAVEEEKAQRVEVVPASRKLPRPGQGAVTRPAYVSTGNVVVLGGGELSDTRWLS